MGNRRVRTIKYARMDSEKRNILKGEILEGLMKIKVYSLYDQPSQKIPDKHRKNYGLCRNCTHLMLVAAESQILWAGCNEVKRVNLNSGKPVTECSWYQSEKLITDSSDLMHGATIIDVDDTQKAGLI